MLWVKKKKGNAERWQEKKGKSCKIPQKRTKRISAPRAQVWRQLSAVNDFETRDGESGRT